eukprot:5341432-Ditylum_brightwellii.AAC.1
MLTNIWSDLHNTLLPEVRLLPKEASQKGFKMFMMALFSVDIPQEQKLTSKLLQCVQEVL